MNVELWQGIDFKLAEAEFFLDKMGEVLVPPQLTDPTWHPSYGPTSTRWQPDFYFYLDAFLGAARSIPDVIQKCFGWDSHSKDEWSEPPDEDEIQRRKRFQQEFKSHYVSFSQQVLSGVRVGTFHWRGVPSVTTKATVFCGQEYVGRPGELIPSLAPRQYPPGTDPAFLAIFNKPLPVEPSWQDFTVEIPQDDGSTQSKPLFAECKHYLKSAQSLVKDSKVICDEVHAESKLTPPPIARERKS